MKVTREVDVPFIARPFLGLLFAVVMLLGALVMVVAALFMPIICLFAPVTVTFDKG